MKKGASTFLIFAGTSIASAGVYVGFYPGLFAGYYYGVGSGVTKTTVTTTTTTTTPEEKPQFSLASYDGGEYPMTEAEAAWVLSKTNIVTGAELGDRNGLSEQAFAMASLIYKCDTVDARTTFKEIFNVSSELEGKLYGLMGMKALGDVSDYAERAKLLEPAANVNCLIGGKYYVIPVSEFLKAFEKDMYTFVPVGFPEAPIVAKKEEPATTSSVTSTTTSTTVSSVSHDYFPGYFWQPSYVIIDIRPRPRPPHPRPRPPRPRPVIRPSTPPPSGRPVHQAPQTRPAPQGRPAPQAPQAQPTPQARPAPQAPQARPAQEAPQARPTPQQRPAPQQSAPRPAPQAQPRYESRPAPQPRQEAPRQERTERPTQAPQQHHRRGR